MKIFLDDIRNAPDDSWFEVRTVPEAVNALLDNATKVTVLSLDHDLGDDQETGYDLCNMLERWIGRGDLPISILPERFEIHSANPVGRKNMQAAIDSIERIRSARD